jgi:hypothetical protein
MGRLTMWVVAGLMTLAAAGTVRADWNPNDPYKMHFPQLPDPNGWDVAFAWQDPGVPGIGQPAQRVPNFLADDWRCSETGPVSDVHFWLSMQGDLSTGTPPPFQIGSVLLC